VDSYKILEAIQKIIQKVGSLNRLAKSAGCSASVIHNVISGKSKVDNITIGTLHKLFPDFDIVFFPDEENENFKVSDHLSAELLSDWINLDEVEKAEAIAAIKRIIKNRPVEMMKVAEDAPEYKPKKRRTSDT